MRIVLLHGYLFEGSGSNIYVQNLARALCKLGHEVHLFCQERRLEKYDFVNSYSRFRASNKSWRVIHRKQTPYRGSCHVYNPNIGSMIPVYVKDKYEFFKTVKEFPQLSNRELENHIDNTKRALQTLLGRFTFDGILANHSIISPTIAYRATRALERPVPYMVLCHGSAFNYSVKKSAYLKELVEQAMKHAKRVYFPSNYFRKVLLKEFSPTFPALKRKSMILHCGVDVAAFKSVYSINSRHIKALHTQLKRKLKFEKKTSALHRLDTDVIQKLKTVRFGQERVLLFVGKFIPSKGPQVVIHVFQKLVKKYPDLRLIFVGFGKGRPHLEEMKKHVKAKDRVIFTGLMEHTELRYLLPLVDVLFVPSLFPETFGMIAVEGMASGVPTLVTYQSGLKDMHKIADSLISQKNVTLKKCRVNKSLAKNLSANVGRLFSKGLTRNRSLKKMFHEHARTHFSWTSIAKTLLRHLKS